jgi:protein required for attachment to host cells
VVAEIVSAVAKRSTRDLGSERPGRVFESATATRHAIESASDLHQKGKTEFAQMIAEQVDTAAKAGGSDSLALVAPARVLREIKTALGGEAAARLRATLAKDLTKLPEAELCDRLGSIRKSVPAINRRIGRKSP